MESLWNKNVYWNNLRDMFDFTKKKHFVYAIQDLFPFFKLLFWSTSRED
jgi:hypothetical protein